uniref:TPM domain-containing protein n=1 Tax=Panagrolaimus superbus TaxID=310955 RepID=A0A914YPW5_9BILA
MNFSSQICDPDTVFTMDDRNKINTKLKWLESSTSKNNSNSNDCSEKGLFGLTIVGKTFQGGTSDSLKEITNDLISKWNSESICKKLIIIAFASEDRKVWISGDSGVSIKCEKYSKIFQAQKSLFQSGNFSQAILNIIDSLRSTKDDNSGINLYNIITIAVIVLGCGLCAFCCHYCCRNTGSWSSGGEHYGGGSSGGGGGGGGGGCGGGGGGF